MSNLQANIVRSQLKAISENKIRLGKRFDCEEIDRDRFNFLWTAQEKRRQYLYARFYGSSVQGAQNG